MIEALVNIDVDDLNKGIDFYTRALGLRVGRRLGDTIVEMLGASSPIYLLENATGSPAVAGTELFRDYERHWTPVHIDFVVANIQEAVDKARAAGATIEADVQTHVWGHIAMLSDPFGHGLCLLEFLDKGYDEIAQTEA